MSSMSEHVARMSELGFNSEMIAEFERRWKALEAEGYEMYAMYAGTKGSPIEEKAGCVICSKNASDLEWREVVTPSMDSAAVYSACRECMDQYVDAAMRQKALGRLLKERNTRPT